MSPIAYLVSDYSAPSHTFVRREIAALRADGLEIIPFSVNSDGSTAEKIEPLIGRFVPDYFFALLQAVVTRPTHFISSWLLALRHRQKGLRGLVWAQFHFVEAIMLAHLLVIKKCTRLHSHFANSGATVAMIASHFIQIPWSLTLHGISETDHPAGMLLPEKLERAEFIACASYFMQAQAMRMVKPSHWSKMHIVRCGINLSSLPQVNDHPAKEAGPIRMICVGRLSPEKGYFGLLDVLANLRADTIDFEITIVGDGSSGQKLHDRVASLGLSENVCFTGFLPEADTLDAINQSDIFILPSLMEGLPVVLIEALALSKAAIASRVAGIPELIKDGHSGLLFTPSDWTDLERQIRRTVRNKELRKSLGRNGRSIVEKNFQSCSAAKQLATLFLADPLIR